MANQLSHDLSATFRRAIALCKRERESSSFAADEVLSSALCNVFVIQGLASLTQSFGLVHITQILRDLAASKLISTVCKFCAMQAYRIACHLGDQEESLDATMRITSSTVFNKILLFMIKEVHFPLQSIMKPFVPHHLKFVITTK